ncbi:MAG: alpha/beta fold hydrolase [Clostridia bacterium]|nr:alpha/beta fold hydrolase [Clostridia bacterium]
MNNKLLKSIIVTVGAGISICGAVGNYFVDSYLSKKGIARLQQGPGMLDEETRKILHSSPESVESLDFYRSTCHRMITTPSVDGLNLHAICYDNPSDIYVIFCHGFTGDPNCDNVFAKRYFDMGYNVILPYSRAHGKSEHKYCSMGYFERFDIVEWTKYITNINSDAKIFLHGVSMGSATVMMATGEALPDTVRGCIADCGFTSLYDLYSTMIKKLFPEFMLPVIINSANAVAKAKIGFDFRDAAPIKAVAKSVTPTLFIHGEKDDFVPFSMLDPIYNAATCEKHKLIVPDSAHAISELVNPELYWSTVSDFIKKYSE